MEKTWKPIPTFSNYEASSDGELRSLNYKRSGRVVVLNPSLTSDGYMKTMLLDDTGKYRSWTVHKFVTLAFFGDRQGLEVNHKNGIKTDNRIHNLEYVSRSENIKHAYANRLMRGMVGVNNPNSKLTNEQVVEIRNHASTHGKNYGRKELALKYNVSECCIKEVVNHRRGIWKLA